MIDTFYHQNQLGAPTAFFAALVVGAAFGFVLERAGFGSSRRLAGVFYFKDMAVIKVMFTAMLTAMLGMAMLFALGWVPPSHVHFMETVYGAHAIGGLLFGIGFVMGGWCPGTAAVGLASGKWDALAFLGGTLLGAVVFNEVFAWIKPLYDWGLQSEPSLAFGLPIAIFAFAFCIVGVAAFYASEWIEQRTGGAGKFLHSPLLKGLSVAIIAFAASLFVFPSRDDGKHVVARPVLPNLVNSEDLLLDSIDRGADHIEPEVVADRLSRGDPQLLLVDVRPANEFQRFHLRGAVNVSLADLPGFLEPYRYSHVIALYSNGMTHPAQARDLLAMRGYPNVYVLSDGLQGFLDRCLRPASIRDAPLPPEHADRISTWRRYFLTDTNCPAGWLEKLDAKVLQPISCGSIARLNSVDGIFLASQPFPDDFRLAKQGGIKTVVNLRFPDELDWDEAGVISDLGLDYQNIPFKDPESLVDEIFSRTRATLNDQSKKPLLLHCHSANRVGAIWLAHRVLDDGLSIADAETEAVLVGLKSPEYLAKAKDYISRAKGKPAINSKTLRESR